MKCHLRHIRKASKLSLRELSAKTGIPHSTLARLERGAEVQLSTARKIARFFKKWIADVWPE